MAYSEEVMDHYNNPRNMGLKLDEQRVDVGTGVVGAPSCGDLMRLQIEVKNGIIVDTRVKVHGCGSAIASSSYVSEMIKGKSLIEAEQIKNTEICQKLKLPPVKIHCSLLAEDAIKEAISDYRMKNPEREE